MLQLYRFKLHDGLTTREAAGNTEKEAADKLKLTPKDWESYEILPGKSLTAEASGTPVPESTNAPVNPTPEPIKAEANMPGEKKSRKPRADKGQPRGKSPDKPKKRPMVYHLVDGTVTIFETKELLDEALSMAPDTVILRVIAGGKLHQVECQKRFVLSK